MPLLMCFLVLLLSMWMSYSRLLSVDGCINSAGSGAWPVWYGRMWSACQVHTFAAVCCFVGVIMFCVVGESITMLLYSNLHNTVCLPRASAIAASFGMTREGL